MILIDSSIINFVVREIRLDDLLEQKDLKYLKLVSRELKIINQFNVKNAIRSKANSSYNASKNKINMYDKYAINYGFFRTKSS